MEKKLNKIKVIASFYNPGKFLETNVNSLLTQDYENYEILYINDCSTDKSELVIPSCYFKIKSDGTPELDLEGKPVIDNDKTPPILQMTKCKGVTLWNSSQRNTALPNIHNGVINFCTDPDDIVVIVDGDDTLLGRGALSSVNDFFNEHDCWFSYGSCIWTSGHKDFSRPYSKENFDNIRKVPFQISHLRAWRAGAYHQIAKQDPEMKCFKDKNGEFLTMSYDTCLCFPLCEICGFDKVKHNSKQLYIYNRDNPISEDKVDQSLQTAVHMEVSSRPSFKQVKDYKTGELV
jgi:glycosyltransferase involved in cell wall biosynthesis